LPLIRRRRDMRPRILSWLIVAAWATLSLLAFYLPGLLPGRATSLPAACANYPVRALRQGASQAAETHDTVTQADDWSGPEWLALTPADPGDEGSPNQEPVGSQLAYELFPRSNLPGLSAAGFSAGSARSSAGGGGASGDNGSSSSGGSGIGGDAGGGGYSSGEAALLSAISAHGPGIEIADGLPPDGTEAAPWPRWDPKTDPALVFFPDRVSRPGQTLGASARGGHSLTIGGYSGFWAGSDQMHTWAALTDAYRVDPEAGSTGNPESGEGGAPPDGWDGQPGGNPWWPNLLALSSPVGSLQVTSSIALLLQIAADRATQIPEPAPAFLMLLGGAAFLFRRLR
jgi:hypothetical protein